MFERNTQMSCLRRRVSPQGTHVKKQRGIFETVMFKVLKEICLIPEKQDGRKLRQIENWGSSGVGEGQERSIPEGRRVGTGGNRGTANAYATDKRTRSFNGDRWPQGQGCLGVWLCCSQGRFCAQDLRKRTEFIKCRFWHEAANLRPCSVVRRNVLQLSCDT